MKLTTGPGTIRIGLMVVGFVGVTIGLIVLQPGPRGHFDPPADLRQVSRGQSDLSMTTAPTQPAATGAREDSALLADPAPGTAPHEEASAPADQTGNPSSALPVTAPGVAFSPDTPQPGSGGAVALAMAQDGTLRGAGAQRSPAPSPELREMSWSILESLNAASGRDAAPGEPGSLLHTIVGRAMQDPSIDPAHLQDRRPRPDPAVSASASAPAGTPTAGRTYVVQSGDTLRLIAQRAYGDAAAYERIFNANRDRMDSTEDLRSGQVIRLP